MPHRHPQLSFLIDVNFTCGETHQCQIHSCNQTTVNIKNISTLQVLSCPPSRHSPTPLANAFWFLSLRILFSCSWPSRRWDHRARTLLSLASHPSSVLCIRCSFFLCCWVAFCDRNRPNLSLHFPLDRLLGCLHLFGCYGHEAAVSTHSRSLTSRLRFRVTYWAVPKVYVYLHEKLPSSFPK